METLDASLKTAFSKIKQDIAELQRQQRELEQGLDIASIKKSLKEEILRELMPINEQRGIPPTEKEETSHRSVNRSASSPNRSVTVRRTIRSTELTPLQIEVLKRLMVLQLESNRRGLSMRELAFELYPDKAYTQIKSTLSEAVTQLHQATLIEKMRMGRLVFVSYTEKALQYADEARLNRMKDLISKPWQKME